MATLTLINKPKIKELCSGEIHDFILELIKRELNNLPPEEFSRRRELCEALLACNFPVGKRAEIKEKVSQIFNNWSGNDSQISILNSLGFNITSGKKHDKLHWHDSKFYKTLPKTPSDRRGGDNALAEINKTFF